MADFQYIIDLSPTSPAYFMAINLVVISLLLSGFALGISRAIRSKKLWGWGVEELSQSIINAALLGALMAGAPISASLASSLIPSELSSTCPSYSSLDNASPTPLSFSLCSIDSAIEKGASTAQILEKNSFLLGTLSSLQINANVISAQPFLSLQYSAQNYSSLAWQIYLLLTSLELQKQFLFFIASFAFSLFLPAGLILRLFFATRKMGGAIMGGAIAFFLIYPLAYSAFAADASFLEETYLSASSDLDSLSAALSPIPLIDWEKEGAISNLMYNLWGQEISSKVYLPYSSTSAFLGALAMQALIFPLICIAISLVCAKELSSILGSEFKLDLFEMV